VATKTAFSHGNRKLTIKRFDLGGCCDAKRFVQFLEQFGALIPLCINKNDR
jgi:hypothetical protein